MTDRQDSPRYRARRARFDRLLTIYGRKPVLEALENADLDVAALHAADSNRPGAVLEAILALARRRGIPLQQHSKQALSRISATPGRTRAWPWTWPCPPSNCWRTGSAILRRHPGGCWPWTG